MDEKECEECGVGSEKLFYDPREPPINSDPCLCADCAINENQTIAEEALDEVKKIKEYLLAEKGRLTHVQQPVNSKLCGHACIAMLRNIPLDEAIKLVGHEKGMMNWEILRALGKVGEKFSPVRDGPVPRPSIIRLKWGDSQRHHLVIFATDGKVYDPLYSLPAPSFLNWFLFTKKNKGRIVSFYMLEKLAVSWTPRVGEIS